MISTDDVPTDEQVETSGSAPVAAGSPDGEQTPTAEVQQQTADVARPAPRQPVELTPAAVELALEAARSVAGDEAGGVESVGDYLGAHAEDAIAVTAGFQARIRGYHGWQWSVTLASLAADSWTVSEVVLLPGDDALVAPPWVPWDRRVRGGDLGPGDLLPTPVDDPRLVPGYLLSDDPAVEEVAREFGLGRSRVLSRDGRVDAAERWYEGAFGPSDPMAQQAPGRCGQCGFFAPLAGSLGGMFGACTNDMAPGDGRVVAVEYGCGAHSEAVVAMLEPSGLIDLDGLRVDEERIDVHVRAQADSGEAGLVEDTAPDAALELVDDAAVDAVELTDEVPVDEAAGDDVGGHDVVVDDVVGDEAVGDEAAAPESGDAPESLDEPVPIADQEPADTAPDVDPELAAAPTPGEDAALQAILELLPPISTAETTAGTADADAAHTAGTADPDAGVVTD